MTAKPGWFAPKRYGYGSGWPIRWEGWAFIAAVVAALSVAGRFHGSIRWMAVVAIVACTLPIAAAKTEGGWRWRWGGDTRG